MATGFLNLIKQFTKLFINNVPVQQDVVQVCDFYFVSIFIDNWSRRSLV